MAKRQYDDGQDHSPCSPAELFEKLLNVRRLDKVFTGRWLRCEAVPTANVMRQNQSDALPIDAVFDEIEAIDKIVRRRS